jgi:predicted ATP-dependent serine protease
MMPRAVGKVLQQVEPAPKLFTRRGWGDVMNDAAQRPMPRKLIGDLLCEGELAILFGGTGDGKTAFAVHVGNDIASGRSTTGLDLETDPEPVLYFDFELSDTQQARRYSEEHRNGDGRVHFTNLFPFHKNFQRVEMDASAHVFDRLTDWEQFMLREMDREIVDSRSKTIIVDNITYLARETDKGKFALPLMQRLCEWKKERGLSILVLAHTPKRDEAKPLSINDLAGSKILSNFADSVFGIGKSTSDRVRYVKQFKVRSGELVYSAENVAVFQFEKTDNHLGFSLIGHSKESAHLVHQTDEAKEKLIADVQSMSAEGKSQREISSDLQISLGTVHNYLKKSAGNGHEIKFSEPWRQREWESWPGQR